ncbi:MAG: hypothetical protein LC122_02535 [Chitinophagales bacterium]|nr:hypothetical protein [Chitinophagales bacterium]
MNIIDILKINITFVGVTFTYPNKIFDICYITNSDYQFVKLTIDITDFKLNSDCYFLDKNKFSLLEKKIIVYKMKKFLYEEDYFLIKKSFY